MSAVYRHRSGLPAVRTSERSSCQAARRQQRHLEGSAARNVEAIACWTASWSMRPLPVLSTKGKASSRSKASCGAAWGSIARSSDRVVHRTTEAASRASRVSGSRTSARYIRVSSSTTSWLATSSRFRSRCSVNTPAASLSARGWPQATRLILVTSSLATPARRSNSAASDSPRGSSRTLRKSPCHPGEASQADTGASRPKR